MKKLKVKKGSTCMACLECVMACSQAFYKTDDPGLACLEITEKKTVRPMTCPQCGKECQRRLYDQQKEMYRMWQMC